MNLCPSCREKEGTVQVYDEFLGAYILVCKECQEQYWPKEEE